MLGNLDMLATNFCMKKACRQAYIARGHILTDLLFSYKDWNWPYLPEVLLRVSNIAN